MLPSYLRSCHTCLAACIVIACGGPASADDSEIFFNPAARAGVRSNVLLILDTSRGPDENEAGFPAVVKSAAAELLRSLGVAVGARSEEHVG